MARGRKTHLNIAIFLLLQTSGSKPRLPAQQASVLAITPLGTASRVVTWPWWWLDRQTFALPSYRSRALATLGAQWIHRGTEQGRIWPIADQA